MARISWCLVFTFFSMLATGFCRSHITVNGDGGYENIVVAISPNISEEEGDKLIGDLQHNFKQASKVLYDATNSLSFFKSVTFLIPPTWKSIQKDSKSTFETYQDADVRILPSNGNEEEIFSTIQLNGCGQPGEYIQISTDNFSQLRDTKNIRRLAQHWAKYRYGVFEENGKTGSQLYPEQYKSGSGVNKTGCAYPYPWENITNCEHTCEFEKIENINATSSLMDFGNVDAHLFCDKANHNPEAPTLHNTLCHQKSIQEIINSSTELKNVTRPEKPPKVEDVRFKKVDATLKSLFIVVDPELCPGPSATNEAKGVQDTIFMSVAMFIEDILPPNLNIALLPKEKNDITFPHNKNEVFKLWNSEVCNRLFKPGSRNIAEALHMALEAGENVVIILNGKSANADLLAGAFGAAQERIRSVYLFTYPSLENIIKWTVMARKNEIDWYHIPHHYSGSEKDIKSCSKLEAVFTDITNKMMLRFSPRYMTLYSRHINNLDVITGNFTVSSVNTQVAFSLNTQPFSPTDQINVEVNGTSTQMEPAGRVLDWYKSEINLLCGYYQFTISGDNLNRMEYHLSITEYTEDAKFVPEIATLADQTQGFSVLRVSVHRNGMAVHGAHVTAILNSTEPSYELKDDGKNGDTLENDGIYSRYYKTTESGFIFVDFTVEYNSPAYDGFSEHTGPGGTSFVVKKQDSFFFEETMGDLIPPSRITDLAFDNTAGDTGFTKTFKWTAPGNDFDEGSVSKYELKCSTNRKFVTVEDLFNSNEKENFFNVTATKNATEVETHTLDIQIEYDKTWFCAVRAADEAGNYNSPSNIVTSYVNTPTTTTKPTTTTETPATEQPTITATDDSTTLSTLSPNTFTTETIYPSTNLTNQSTTSAVNVTSANNGGGSSSSSLQKWQIALIAVGSFLFLLLLIVLVWFFRFRKRKTITDSDSVLTKHSRGSVKPNNQVDHIRPQSGIQHLDNADIYGGFPNEGRGTDPGGSRDRRPFSGDNTLSSTWGDTALDASPNNGVKKHKKSNEEHQLQSHDNRRASVISEYASYMPAVEDQAYQVSMENELYAEGVDGRVSYHPRDSDDQEVRGYLAKQTARTSISSNLMPPDGVTLTDDPVYSEVDKSKKVTKSRPNTAENKNVRVATQV